MSYKIDYEKLSHDLSESVIALNDQRRDLLAAAKSALYGANDDGGMLTAHDVYLLLRAAVAKAEKAAGLASKVI